MSQANAMLIKRRAASNVLADDRPTRMHRQVVTAPSTGLVFGGEARAD